MIGANETKHEPQAMQSGSHQTLKVMCKNPLYQYNNNHCSWRGMFVHDCKWHWFANVLPITVTSKWARWRLKHQPYDCLLNRLFRRRSQKTSKLRVTGLCAGNSPVTGEFSAQLASSAANVSIWWRHHTMAETDIFLKFLLFHNRNFSFLAIFYMYAF